MPRQPNFFARDLRLTLDKQIGREAAAKRLAQFSREKLGEAVASGQGSPFNRTFVNGREGAREETVQPPGPIVYLFNWWPQVLIHAITFLRNRSPVGRGSNNVHYRDRFFVLANGSQVTTRQYQTIDPRAEIIIGNSASYHRKLDVQMIGGKRLNVSVPPGILEDAVIAIRARFGGLLEVKRVHSIAFTGQYQLKTGRRAGGDVNSPAIILSPRV